MIPAIIRTKVLAENRRELSKTHVSLIDFIRSEGVIPSDVSGKLSGNNHLEVEGKVEKIAGKVQEKIGRVEVLLRTSDYTSN